MTGTLGGGVIALVVGVLGGPLGVIVGVLRRSVDDVEAEIAAAEHAQRQAKRQARKDLFDAHRKQQKADIDAKVAALKAKIPGQKHLAAAGS